MKKIYNTPEFDRLSLPSEDVCVLSFEGDGDVVGVEFADWIRSA